MDLSKVGEKLLNSVRSARSLGLLPSISADRPEVPVRAVQAAAIARALAILPPHQRLTLPSNSEDLVFIYGIKPHGQTTESLEEEFYEEDFDPVRHVLQHIPLEENGLSYFETKATLRLAQLDGIAERLSRHVMEHHEEMGMFILLSSNGRRHLGSSVHEVSRDLVVTSNARRKQALLDLLPILTQLHHTLEMQGALNTHVEDGSYRRAFQVLSEYLQLLDSHAELSAVQEMSRGVEAWLGKTLQQLDSLLLGVCQDFKEKSYLTVVDAYALIGDTAGLTEKIQSFFMQEVLSETHSALKDIIHEVSDLPETHSRSRHTYSDLCLQIPESKFRQCLLRTLEVLFNLMCSYYDIMAFQLPGKDSEAAGDGPDDVPWIGNRSTQNGDSGCSEGVCCKDSLLQVACDDGMTADVQRSAHEAGDDSPIASSSTSPCDQLKKDAVLFISQALQRGRKNLWQLTTSRVSVLLSCDAVYSTNTHQFLRNYEDLNTFILAGEAFCGTEAIDFRQRLKTVCRSYFGAFHRQSIDALRMVLEKETWQQIPPDTMQVVSLEGLVGDGAPLIVPSDGIARKMLVQYTENMPNQVEIHDIKDGFSLWVEKGNPFTARISGSNRDCGTGTLQSTGPGISDVIEGVSSHVNGDASVVDDENEDLLADFIDEDSQLPSRISRPAVATTSSINLEDDEIRAQTGSSLSLLRLMDKYARLMQKLQIVNVDFFEGICQLFEVYFHSLFKTFGQRDLCINGVGTMDSIPPRLRNAFMRITQDLYDHRTKSQAVSVSSASPGAISNSVIQTEVTPVNPSTVHSGHIPSTSFGLKERCIGPETLSHVAQILYRSKAHLQSMLQQNNGAIVEDFYRNMVDSVLDLVEHIHRTTARLLLNINGYVDRVANAKWEFKELGLEHNGYVDLLLGEFKHYKMRLAHAGIRKEIQDVLLEYGLENVAETLIEGLSRVKRCTNEGRALMSLDLQVLINGLQHFVSINVKPKMHIVESFIKAYYLPETEYVHWARSHPEYSKNQVIGLVNLVASMNNWKRKTRLEMLEKIEAINS
ncbi:hypothetical protein AMTRI_Chr07g78870 [Amborella trichopoda]